MFDSMAARTHVFFLSRFTDKQLEKMQKVAALAAIVVGAMIIAMFAQGVLAAGDTTDETFKEVWDTLEKWTKGTLGRIIAIAFIIIGAVAGAARQSLMAFAVGIAAALGLYNAPSLITNVFSATLPVIGG